MISSRVVELTTYSMKLTLDFRNETQTNSALDLPLAGKHFKLDQVVNSNWETELWVFGVNPMRFFSRALFASTKHMYNGLSQFKNKETITRQLMTLKNSDKLNKLKMSVFIGGTRMRYCFPLHWTNERVLEGNIGGGAAKFNYSRKFGADPNYCIRFYCRANPRAERMCAKFNLRSS